MRLLPLYIYVVRVPSNFCAEEHYPPSKKRCRQKENGDSLHYMQIDMQNGSLRGPREDTLPNAIQDDIGRSALHEAASIGDEKTLQALLAAGADRNAKDIKHGNTPLHEAAWRGFSRCVKLLCALPQPKVNKDVKEPKIKDVLQETRGALHSALLGARNGGGFSALHLAAQNGHNQSCREILLAGADPDVQNNYGDTPLHTACRYGHAGATRILISAKCDPNRTNLNGDSSLHISCAMGRRKLTRILLEAGSSSAIKNAQDETPRDIAIRKNLPEILEILDNPVPVKPAKDRDRSNSNSKSADKADGRKSKSPGKGADYGANPVNWSPYGCHYFPDPRSFPSPKLETLPKEPLGKGEQYFLDLAGNIRKGPIGVGNTCYCGPFFRHIEERISRNRKSLRKYVHKATERLDNKVQALALRTDDQIEQLTKSMMAERIKCEGRRLHLEQWLRRGDHTRATIGNHSKLKKNLDNTNTLTRCRSLELLDEEDSLNSKKIQNSKSFDMLDEADAMTHRTTERSSDRKLPSSLDSGRKTCRTSGRSKSSGRDSTVDRDSHLVSKRLEEILIKTNEILEMEKVARHRHKDSLAVKHKTGDPEKVKYWVNSDGHLTYMENLMEQFKNVSHSSDKVCSKNVDGTQYIAQEMDKIANSLAMISPNGGNTSRDIPPLSPEIAKDFASQKEFERKCDQEHEKSSIVSGSSQKNLSSGGSGNIQDTTPKRSSKKLFLSEGFSDRLMGNERNSEDRNNTQSAPQYQNLPEAQEDESKRKFKNLLTALRRDYQSTKQAIQDEIINQSNLQESDLPHNFHHYYGHSEFIGSEDTVDATTIQSDADRTYQNTYFEGPSNSTKSEIFQVSSEYNPVPDPEDTIELSDMANVSEINELKNRILNGTNWKSMVLKKSQQIQNKEDQGNKSVNGIVQKFEIKNSEIKTLKSPNAGILKRSKVQQLVENIQGNSQDFGKHSSANSESSEEDQEDASYYSYLNNHDHYTNDPNSSYYYQNRAQPQVAVTYHQISEDLSLDPHQKLAPSKTRSLDTRDLIPKDAYFHELPNKNRMRPITEKLPEKQMINFDDQYNSPQSMLARTRNPLPYLSEYEVPISNNVCNGLLDLRNSSMPLHTPHPLQVPHREKLLSHRKFGFPSSVEYEFSKPNYIHHHQHMPPPVQQIAPMTPEQAQIDRDNNNDSGYSTKICGSSHGPSPSLSGNTDFGGPGGNSGSDVQKEKIDTNTVTYFIGNVGASSLV